LTVVLHSGTTGNTIADAVRISFNSSAHPLSANHGGHGESLPFSSQQDSSTQLQLRLDDGRNQPQIENPTASQLTAVSLPEPAEPFLASDLLVRMQAELAMRARWLQTLAAFASRDPVTLAPLPQESELGEGSLPANDADLAMGEASFAVDTMFYHRDLVAHRTTLSNATALSTSSERVNLEHAALLAMTRLTTPISSSVRVESRPLSYDFIMDLGSAHLRTEWLNFESSFNIFVSPDQFQDATQLASPLQVTVVRQPRLQEIEFLPDRVRTGQTNSRLGRLDLQKVRNEALAKKVEPLSADLVFADWDESNLFD